MEDDGDDDDIDLFGSDDEEVSCMINSGYKSLSLSLSTVIVIGFPSGETRRGLLGVILCDQKVAPSINFFSPSVNVMYYKTCVLKGMYKSAWCEMEMK